MPELAELVAEILPDIIELRHDFHAYPELAFEEERTAQRRPAPDQVLRVVLQDSVSTIGGDLR